MTDNTKEREAAREEYYRQISNLIDKMHAFEEGWLARASQSSAPAWIAVSERLPEVVRSPDGSVNAVLAWGISAPDGSVNFDVSNTLYLHHGNKEQRMFTHWMPLPAPPKEQ